MYKLTASDRAAAYAAKFPKWTPLQVDNDRVYGIWMTGNNYKSTGYYGAYPPGYLKRVAALFQDAKHVLHLFSGKVKKGSFNDKEYTIDINPDLEPDFVGDAHDLVAGTKGQIFDLIVADPPYSKEDAKRYNYPMPNRKKVIHECYKVLRPGGYLVWLDTTWPMYTKKEFDLFGCIGMWRSTNHRVRGITMFKRVEDVSSD